MNAVIQYILYLAVLVILAIPLGAYIKKVMNGEKTFLSKILVPCENAVYRLFRYRSCVSFSASDSARYSSGKSFRLTRC